MNEIKPILAILVDNNITVETDLTDEEKEDINAVLEERDALRAIAREDEQDNSLAGKLSSVIMLLATVAFLLLGFLGGLWHPGWVVFPVGGILCAVVGVIFKKDR